MREGFMSYVMPNSITCHEHLVVSAGANARSLTFVRKGASPGFEPM